MIGNLIFRLTRMGMGYISEYKAQGTAQVDYSQ